MSIVSNSCNKHDYITRISKINYYYRPFFLEIETAMMVIAIPQTSNANIANSDPTELLRANKLTVTVDLGSIISFPCTKM